ncbi:hypothetical protein VTN02DRAFT_3221 [Thermoascus thermophilus]
MPSTPRSARASRTSGTREMTEADRARPWPPASEPCRTKTSGSSASATATASATLPTCTQILVLPAVTARTCRAHGIRSSGWETGPNSHMAQGVYLRMASRATVRSAPQLMNPTPMGRVPFSAGTWRMGGSDSRTRRAACSRSASRVETSNPAARKPSPPARETATASGGIAMRSIGADAMRGVLIQGYAAWRADLEVILMTQYGGGMD